MSRVFHVYAKPLERLKPSLFEKVILANSLMLICEALVGLWVTSHNLEAHHYLIDTSFIVFATLLGLLMNVALIIPICVLCGKMKERNLCLYTMWKGMNRIHGTSNHTSGLASVSG